MKRIITATILLISLVITVLAVSSCAKTPDYQIAVNGSNGVTVTDDGMTVEAGDTVTIPQGEVYDKDGNYCPEFEVTRVITDDSGNRKAGTLQMKHGEVYTVTYTATNGTVTLEKVMKLYGYDTILPTLTLLNFQKAYAVGDTIQIKVKDISSDVDYDKSTIVLKNLTSNTTTDLSFTESYSFKAENESEQYKVVAELTDKSGNKQTIEYGFAIIGNFKDTDIDKNDIWDFDEIGYSNNINVSGESDDLEYSIVTSDLPEDTNSMGIGSGALKLLLKAGETYTFTLTNGNGVLVENAGTIGFKLWTSDIIDIFEVYNVDNGLMYDLSWKASKRNAWQKVEFDPLGTFTADYTFDKVKIILSCEKDVTVYLDSVYYTDNTGGWRDEDLEDGVLAEFDDIGYLERIDEALNIESTTFGGMWSIVDTIPGTTDFTKGALKFVSTTNGTAVSDGSARDGFVFNFMDKLSYDDIDGFVFRIYSEDSQRSLALNFIDQKMGTVGGGWYTIEDSAGRWINVIVRKDQLTNLTNCKNITGVMIRFIRPQSYAAEGQEEFVTYIDRISVYKLDYDKIDYDFADEKEVNAVESLGNATPQIVEDPLAKDGWALYAKTKYNATTGSGLQINFNRLDLTYYKNIYVRVRTLKSDKFNGYFSVKINGLNYGYKDFPEYTEIDILPFLLENDQRYLESVSFTKPSQPEVEIFIDEITFVSDESRPKYEDFTIGANEFKNNSGYNGYDAFEGGKLSNVENTTFGSYQGKDNVLSFTTTANGDTAYSGGGFYVDFSKYLPDGKIIAVQEFTITISVYVPESSGYRIGILSGNKSSDISFKNVWKNPYGNEAGWKTITITSDELHAKEGCYDTEITGIYVGVNSIGYTCGIESVTVTFNN